MFAKLWKWLAATFSIVVILLALSIGLFRLLLPAIPRYHEKIEAFASEAAGTAVTIEKIAARWGLDGPELRFDGAQFFAADGENVLLRADQGRVVIDLTALMSGKLRAGQVLLDGLKLEVMRGADNLWRVGGVVLNGSGESALPRRLSVGLRDAEVVFTDLKTGVGPWIFEEVDLNLELRRDSLSLDSAMRLPPGLGREAEISLQANGNFEKFSEVQWQLYAYGDDIDFYGWAGIAPPGRVVPTAGQGNAVLWFSAEGNDVQQASVQTSFRDLDLTRDGQIVHELDRLTGRIEFDRIAGGWTATGRDIALEQGSMRWPVSGFHLEQVSGEDETHLLYGDFDYLRLDDVAPFLDWIPDKQLRARLSELNPRGVLRQLSFRTTSAAATTESYTLRASFEDLGINASEQLPGFDQLAGDIRLDTDGGRLTLLPRAVRIDLPDILGEPLLTQRLGGAVVWRRGPAGWTIVSDNIDIAHPFFAAATDFELTIDPEKQVSMDLQVQLADMNLPGLRRLIPRPVLKPQLIKWLDRALVSGGVPTATIDWSGPVSGFPFADGGGEFRAVAEVRNARIDYAEGWPEASGIDGTIVFENETLTAGLSAAQIAGNRIGSAQLSIADLRRSMLELHTSADGLLDNLHRFLKQSPLSKNAGDIVQRLSFEGDGNAVIDIKLPLNKKLNAKPEVSVLVMTESGDIALEGIEHRLTDVSGSLRYHNGTFHGDGIRARLLDSQVVIDVMPDQLVTDEKSYPTTRAEIAGRLTDSGLVSISPVFEGVTKGSAAYSATVLLPVAEVARPLTIDVVSNLDGMALTLPEPLLKPAGTSKSFSIAIGLPDDNAQTDIVLDEANARINWLVNSGGWQLERGGLHFGTETANLPGGSGMAITGAVDILDVGGWIEFFSAKESDEQGAVLRGLRIDAIQLEAFGETIPDAALVVDRSDREWLVQIDSQTVSGALFVPFEIDSSPIIANMQVLHIANGEAVDPTEPPPDPRDIPAMIIQADDFHMADMDLGALEARLVKDADGIVLEQFSTTNSAFSTSGSGSWDIFQDGHRTGLSVKLNSTDVRPTLERLGFEGVIDADKADVQMDLTWRGPPGGKFRESLDGDVRVRVESGQIDTVEPGAGRALGLLSFTALPRRLSLDFRDVFEKGFGFDYIQGDFTLDDGDAYTSNLILEGPAAQVGIAGRTGLVKRDYDQTAVVYGNLGATLPVAGAIAGGPIGGAAMLIFSELFKRPLQNMARANYRITGSWDEPAVERVLISADGEGAS